MNRIFNHWFSRSARARQCILWCGSILFLFAAPIFSFAQAAAQPYRYERLFYFRDTKAGRQSLFAYWNSIDVFAPQSYAFDDQGNLTGSLDPQVLSFAKRVGLKIMPLVTNDGFSKNAAHALLDNPAQQTIAIQQLIDEATKNGYQGWQLDFEQMDASYRDRFSAFVGNFSAALRAKGLVSSVAVVAQISENPVDYPNNLWQKLIGVYDYAALGRAADFVSVMSYDDPESIGPVARQAWLADVLAWSMARIPKNKISLGIGLYYWQWNVTSGARVGIGGYEGIKLADKKHYLSWRYSATEQAPYASYWSRGMQYIIWYENGRSIAKKITLITKYKLRGFSAWALGLEVPSVYQGIRK